MAKSDSTLTLPRIVAPDAATPAATDVEIEAEVLALFAQCGRPLVRYVGSFGVGAHDTEDVVQEVFLSLVRHLQLGKPRSNLRGWVFRVAHNLALKHRARAKRRAQLHGASPPAAEPLDPASNPEDRLAIAQRQRRLMGVLYELPEQDRRCLYLRAEGLRYREIADVLGISLGSVSKSLTRSILCMVNVDES